MKKKRILRHLYFQWAGRSGEGNTLELIEADENGEVAEGGLCPAATLVADDDENRWLEIYVGDELIWIPLSEVVRAIELSKDGVHGEVFYDQFDRPDGVIPEGPDPT